MKIKRAILFILVLATILSRQTFAAVTSSGVGVEPAPAAESTDPSSKTTDVLKETADTPAADGKKASFEEVPPQKIMAATRSFRLRSGVALQSFNTSPVGVQEDEMIPPYLTMILDHAARSTGKVQLAMKGAVSMLKGQGYQLFGEFGVRFRWDDLRFHLGAEARYGLERSDFVDGPLQSSGFGYFAKATLPLGRFLPGLEFRHRKLSESEISRTEGISTYIQHEGDTLLRPSMLVDLGDFDLWGALALYMTGNTSVASRDFGFGFQKTSFYILAVGAGYTIGNTEIWIKGQALEGIDDVSSLVYQVPQVYPDFLLAKESLFLEVLFNF